MALAAEESSKSKAAKEVIKSLTAQVIFWLICFSFCQITDSFRRVVYWMLFQVFILITWISNWTIWSNCKLLTSPLHSPSADSIVQLIAIHIISVQRSCWEASSWNLRCWKHQTNLHSKWFGAKWHPLSGLKRGAPLQSRVNKRL